MEMEMVTRIQGVPACGSHDIRPRGWSKYSKRGSYKKEEREGEVQGRNPAELSSLHLAIVCLFLQLW